VVSEGTKGWINPAALQMVLCVLTGWLDRREREAVETRQLVVRMAVENPTWGYTRIQGAFEERRASRGPLDQCPHLEGGRRAVCATSRAIFVDGDCCPILHTPPRSMDRFHADLKTVFAERLPCRRNPSGPTSWQNILARALGVIVGADFFTTEVWTWRGLVTY
jgi:hypothetical protein